MPMYKKVMGALGIILLLVAGISFYDYQQSGQAVDLSTLSSDTGEKKTAGERQVAVYVTGEVAKPGVVYVPWEGRVGDAINQCGGLLPTADSSQVNMAATVKDGMEIRVKGKAISKDGTMGSGVNQSSGEGSVASRASKTSSPEQGKNADGEIVKCIGAGDLFHDENALKIVYTAMKKDQAKWAFGEMAGYCIENGVIKNKNFFAPLEKYPYKLNQLSLIRKKIIVCHEYISGAAMFFHKNYLYLFLKKIEDCVIYAEDIIQVLIMLEDPNVLYIKDKLILYEIGSGISTTSKGSTLVDKDIDRFDKYLMENYADPLIKQRLYRERVIRKSNRLYKYIYLLLESPIRIIKEKYARHPLYTLKENLGYLEKESFCKEFKLLR